MLFRSKAETVEETGFVANDKWQSSAKEAIVNASKAEVNNDELSDLPF